MAWSEQQMWEFGMLALAEIVQQDITTAIMKNSTYREESARQFAVTAAHKAFVRYPELRFSGWSRHPRTLQ